MHVTSLSLFEFSIIVRCKLDTIDNEMGWLNKEIQIR